MTIPLATLKPLKAPAVICEHPGCAAPAAYLFSQATPPRQVSALCEEHARERAALLHLPLPMRKEGKARSAEAGVA